MTGPRIEPTPEIEALFDERRFWNNPAGGIYAVEDERVPTSISPIDHQILAAGIDDMMAARRQMKVIEPGQHFHADDYDPFTIVRRTREALRIIFEDEPHADSEPQYCGDDDGQFYMRTAGNTTAQYFRYSRWGVIMPPKRGKNVVIDVRQEDSGTWALATILHSNRFWRNYHLQTNWGVGEVMSSRAPGILPKSPREPEQHYNRVTETELYLTTPPRNHRGGNGRRRSPERAEAPLWAPMHV